MAANNGSVQLVASFVENTEGRQRSFCLLPREHSGLYALFFNQGQPHGSHMVTVGAPQPDGSRSVRVGASKPDFLPILFSPETLSDETLRLQILRH